MFGGLMQFFIIRYQCWNIAVAARTYSALFYVLGEAHATATFLPITG